MSGGRSTVQRVVLSAVVLVQLMIPASMIMGHERTLQQGERVLFRCRPVDPYDAFRGRYVALGLEPTEVDSAIGDAAVESMRVTRYGLPRQPAYVILEKDAEGFAQIVQVVRQQPAAGTLYLKVKIRSSGEKIYITYFFDRYYMNERLAPRAEQAYRDASGEQEAYVAVRLHRNTSALEELYVNGQAMSTYLATQ